MRFLCSGVGGNRQQEASELGWSYLEPLSNLDKSLSVSGPARDMTGGSVLSMPQSWSLPSPEQVIRGG